jgi:hypothetical protein
MKQINRLAFEVKDDLFSKRKFNFFAVSFAPSTKTVLSPSASCADGDRKRDVR